MVSRETAAVEAWSVDDVGAWVRQLDLNDPDGVVALFQQEGIRGRHLKMLNDSRLRLYGVRGGDSLTILDERDRLLGVPLD